MIVKSLALGMYGTNCYIVVSEKSREAIVIDPGAESKRIISTIDQAKATVSLLVATHGHMDHVGSLERIREHTGAPLAMHPGDVPMLEGNSRFFANAPARSPKAPDRLLNDGDRLSIGDIAFTVLHTPGHSPGGISLAGGGVVFSGDTLFNYGIGRTDFPGCSYEELMESIVNKLLSLPDDTIVYPGHGPSSTIGEERRRNPFIRDYLQPRR